MGGHGGLNILPQKRWNVYNFDNRERVRRDEEAAAREESLRQQQERQKEAESRLAKLRDAKRSSSSHESGDLHGFGEQPPSDSQQDHDENEKMRHISLFNGLIGFQRLHPGAAASEEIKRGMEVDKQIFRGDKELERLYKRATKEATQVGKNGVEADDEHYKLGYGCLGRDKKRPWYLTQSPLTAESEIGTSDADRPQASVKNVEKRKKTIDELREERLKREQQEREKAQRLMVPHPNGQLRNPGAIGAANKRRPYYNSSFGNAR